MRDILKSNTKFNPNLIEDPENIKRLYVERNDLRDIDFERFVNLEALDISHNNITSIKYLPKTLKWLCLADNPIKNYEPLYGLINLEVLWAHQSGININECDLLRKLKHLLLDDCPQIINIDVVKKFESLSILELKNNNVYNIEPVKNLSLTFLNLENNNVADISCLSNMYTLKKLNLKNNYVSDYSVLKTLNLRRLNI